MSDDRVYNKTSAVIFKMASSNRDISIMSLRGKCSLIIIKVLGANQTRYKNAVMLRAHRLPRHIIAQRKPKMRMESKLPIIVVSTISKGIKPVAIFLIPIIRLRIILDMMNKIPLMTLRGGLLPLFVFGCSIVKVPYVVISL
jgi:hypothetical protein